MPLNQINRLIGQSMACACGRTHVVPVQQICFADNALDSLPDWVQRYTGTQPVAIVADERTQVLLGAAAGDLLVQKGFQVCTIVVPDVAGQPPVCDDRTFETLNARLPKAGLLLAVGSGVINDLTKWLAFARQRPYICLPTAATMNGYTAANVAPTLNGVKSLIRAQAPVAVLAQADIIQQAPWHLTSAGLGDVVAKTISVADWKLNHQVYGEHYCAFCADLIAGIEPLYLEQPEALQSGRTEGIAAVFEALLLTGLAMTLMGTSAPASGGEHLFSHTLDMMSQRDGQPHDLHGRQVGIGTLLAAALYTRLQRMESVCVTTLPPEIDRAFWGPLADAVASQYAAKQPHLPRLRAWLADPAGWSSWRHQITPPANTFFKIATCLKTAEAAHTLADIGCSKERARQALLHAHEIRSRVTVIDLAWLSGILPRAADEILADLS